MPETYEAGSPFQQALDDLSEQLRAARFQSHEAQPHSGWHVGVVARTALPPNLTNAADNSPREVNGDLDHRAHGRHEVGRHENASHREVLGKPRYVSGHVVEGDVCLHGHPRVASSFHRGTAATSRRHTRRKPRVVALLRATICLTFRTGATGHAVCDLPFTALVLGRAWWLCGRTTQGHLIWYRTLALGVEGSRGVLVFENMDDEFRRGDIRQKLASGGKDR